MTLELLMQDKYKNGLEQGLAQGKAEAEAKVKEEKTAMIKNLYAKKVSVGTIAECSQLSESEVQAILFAK